MSDSPGIMVNEPARKLKPLNEASYRIY